MILSKQQADGGWLSNADGATDVSASVQAYFALKLTGRDPVDERMVAARQRIHDLGGADAADCVTRFFLALLGQLSYDSCGPTPTKSRFFGAVASRQRSLATVVWARRPVQKISMELGVRELFVNKPCDWPVISAEADEVSSTELHQGSENEIESNEVSELSFYQLIWQIITLRSNQEPADSAELGAYEDALEQLVDIDEATGFAYPRLGKISQADSALALRALLESGMSQNHPAIQEGLDVLCQAPATEMSTVEACHLIDSLSCRGNAELATSAALPPDLDVRWDWQYAEPPGEEMPDWRREAIDSSIAACVKECLRAQDSDGGWCDTADLLGLRAADPTVTGTALESLNRTANEDVESALNLGRQFLQSQQCGDGHWERSDGTQTIQSTSAAIRGLMAHGASANDDCIEAGVNWLAVQQQPNGSWRDSSTETASAILGLVAAGKSDHPVVRRGIKFLLGSQEDQGGWPDRQTARESEDATCCSGDLQSSCRALLALSRFAVAASSAAETASAKEAPLRLIAASIEN